jgi:hypothetical protein
MRMSRTDKLLTFNSFAALWREGEDCRKQVNSSQVIIGVCRRLAMYLHSVSQSRSSCD